MAHFTTKTLPSAPDAVAPDGSDVRVLLGVTAGGMAHFELPPRLTSVAVRHQTVEEIWFFLSGQGEMWRSQDNEELVVTVGPGVCVTIPLGTSFQFRASGREPLQAIGVTMPPWPGTGEAVAVPGHWPSSVTPGPS
jgi:mannose-6-phosphate isomerase-like protein (cupin superfamily)